MQVAAAFSLTGKSVVRNVSFYSRSVAGQAFSGSTLEEGLSQIRQQARRCPNATVSVRVKLNLDPRLNGQKLKGVFDYSHSTRKGCPVAVYTRDRAIADAALSAGASFAGDIMDQITNDEIKYPKDFERIVTTPDLEHDVVHRKLLLERMKRGESVNRVVPDDESELAEVLRTLQITPSIHDRTLVCGLDKVVASVRGYVNGTLVRYATDSDGNLTTRLGTLTMTDAALSENLNTLLQHLLDTRPAMFGTGPRAKKHNRGQYILGIHLVASSRIDPIRLDVSSFALLFERSVQ